MSTELFDEGLQPERTHLAWQRTVLALGLSCAVSARLTAPYLGATGVILSLVGLALAIAVYVGLRSRYRAVNRSLHGERTLVLVSAWPVAAVAVITLLLGILAVLFVALGLSQHTS